MKPLVYQGRKVADYFIDSDGNAWSTKRRESKMIPPHVSGKSKYPNINLYDDGLQITAAMHRVVAETLIKRPRPKQFRPEVWKTLNDAEKSLVYQAYEVNHIDHDVTNYHPSNLEWVSRKVNIEKRNAHYGYVQ
jgi:hypothetical protein